MTAAFAPSMAHTHYSLERVSGALVRAVPSGAQTLLGDARGRPSYLAYGAAILLYVAALGAITHYAKPQEIPQEEPLELVMTPAAEPAATPPPVEQPQQPEVAPPPEVVPPPVAEAPPAPPPEVPSPPVATVPEPVAPVAPPPPPPPPVKKAVAASRPKPKPVAQHRLAAAVSPRSSAAGADRVPPNAVASNYANLIHSRIARIAANSYPRAAMARHEMARVAYRVVIGPSGELISKSISPSGNSLFDAAAAEALARSAPFPSTGVARPVALSGAIAYRLN